MSYLILNPKNAKVRVLFIDNQDRLRRRLRRIKGGRVMSGRSVKKIPCSKSLEGVLEEVSERAEKEFLDAKKKFLKEHGAELAREAAEYEKEIRDYVKKHHDVPSCKCGCHKATDDDREDGGFIIGMTLAHLGGQIPCCIECSFCEREEIPSELFAQHLLCCPDAPEQIVVSAVDGHKKEGE